MRARLIRLLLFAVFVMRFHKTIRVPVHYERTKLKFNKLDKLSAKISRCVWMYSDLIGVFGSLDIGFFGWSKGGMVEMLEGYRYDVMGVTGLGSAYVQQCRDKALECWLSYSRLHDEWNGKVEYYNGNEGYVRRLLKREPSKPFSEKDKKVCCRFDRRTCSKIVNDGNHIKYWASVSSLTKNSPLLVPLNPSRYHANLMHEGKFKTCEIKKKDRKYYFYLTYEFEVEDKPNSFSGDFRGIDLGVCREAVTVLLRPGEIPSNQYVSFFLQKERKRKINALTEQIKRLQRNQDYKQLKRLRNKRRNINEYYERCLAKSIALQDKDADDLCVCIGSLKHIRDKQHKGNGRKRLRKAINSFSYHRRTAYLQNKYNEIGVKMLVVSEYGTSTTCSYCGSRHTERISQSKLICHDCGKTYDADINGARNIAVRKMGANKSFVTYRAGTEQTVHQDEPTQDNDLLPSRGEVRSKRAEAPALDMTLSGFSPE